MDGEIAHVAQCSQSTSSTKAIYLILDTGSIENKCVIIKGLVQSDQLKQHVVSI